MKIEDQDGRTGGGSLSASFRSWRYFFWFLGLILLIVVFYAEENWRGRRDLENYKHELHARGQTVELSGFVPPPVPDAENFALTPSLGPLFDFLPGTQKWRDANALQQAQGISPPYDAARRSIKEEKQARSNSWVKAHPDLVAWHEAFLQKADRDRARTNSATDETASTNAGSLSADLKDRTESAAGNTKATLHEAAMGILAVLSECDSVIEQLRADSRRPIGGRTRNFPTPLTR